MLNRRLFLGATGATMAFPCLLLADAPVNQRFVLVILRGAMDGLHAVPPYADPDYRNLRAALALGENDGPDGILDLDGRFGLHPRLSSLKTWFDQGELAVVHAVATPYRDRSHFDGQDLLENGATAPHASQSGWLNRAIGLLGGQQRLGLALGEQVPLVLRGDVPVASWAPKSMPSAGADFVALVQAMYQGAPDLRKTLDDAVAAIGMTQQALGDVMVGDVMVGAGSAVGGGRRNAGPILAEAAGKLLSTPAGPRIAVLELSGWDTHSAQGLGSGRMGQALQQLNDSLTALKEALGPAWIQTVTMTATEFGRTAAPNGSGGTDHGTASAVFLSGGAVAGKRVITDWPGLRPSALYQSRDLAPTADLRGIVKGILMAHFGLPQDAMNRIVFPTSGQVAPMRDLVRV